MVQLSKLLIIFNMNDFVTMLKALAYESRLRIINLLLTHDLCVGALASHLDISKAAVSQYLQILRKARLVKGERRGYWTHYSVERSVLHDIAKNFIRTTRQMDSLNSKDHSHSVRIIQSL